MVEVFGLNLFKALVLGLILMLKVVVGDLSFKLSFKITLLVANGHVILLNVMPVILCFP